MTTLEIMQRAKAASKIIAAVEEDVLDRALEEMAVCLKEDIPGILAANEADMTAASDKISAVMLDRLRLTEQRVLAMADGILAVKALRSPVGEVLESSVRADGLKIEKTAVPLGVIAIIYESRPNVTSDAAALAVKSGNACILRCGKEAHASAAAITAALRCGLEKAGLPADSVLLVEDTTRESANELMRGNGYIDLLIPRGGKALIEACVKNATVPCVETGTGICHVYVEKTADLEMALAIVENAKTSRPSVCNAEEVLLVDKAVLKDFLPMLEERLSNGKHPVELRADQACMPYLKNAVPAGEADFDTEFLDYILAVTAVDGVEEAVRHIDAHSTRHSEAIVTRDEAAAGYFTKHIDSAAVYVNASTRFTDGGEFGLGCEMGISTQKLHARGPMGLRELTTYKYVVTGNGHIR